MTNEAQRQMTWNELAAELGRAQARIQELEAQAAVLAQALEGDEADLWRVTNAIKDEIASRHWVTEGRGPYEWNEDKYRLEASRAFEAVLKLIAEVQPPAASRFIGVLRNLPAAVQRHLERDRAAAETLKLARYVIGTAEHVIMQCMDGHYDSLEQAKLDSQVAAYRAAVGEGV